MADRTIKPDDTHDLVLQNNDGSAKIEVNEAQTVVLTGGSTTALTIDGSGDTTLAGTANDIGTVTSGTFNGTIGSSATIAKSGMIINTETQSFSVGGTYDTTVSSSYETTGLAVSITPLNTSTKILVLGSFGVSSNSSSYYLALNIYRSGSSVTDEYLVSSTYNGFGRAYTEGGTISPVYIDNPSNSNTTDAITYTVHIKVNGGTGYFGSSSAGSITVCEIKA